ncbi:uncharacterized protein BO97DRAFT_27203 [Aspergillus homomorphus CBS 101889]|uniref:Uncharacterized protein n=1 Tax=Aspergillus homomorphus (strain CBS 101889) TaxID=1450537 RepID=A0A395I2A8_ASPHC|nr:hypothetical protein BO97DRAFT_27203 [Aspergillus homomorphus CBS 101889]RAL13819.1 hypothetical protein BO97DRAFT_27203 [Aspergillus homomorphus CBS 101889]
MPHLVHHHHHRRRHSWPYCGPSNAYHQHSHQPLSRNRTLFQSEQQQQQAYQQHLLEQRFLAPVGSEDLLDDDAASAGISPSPSSLRKAAAQTRSRRWWWWWYSSSRVVPTAPQGNPVGTEGPLRKMMRPPLDKARSLFVMPTTATASHSVDVAGEDALVFTTYWVPQPGVVQVPGLGGSGAVVEQPGGPPPADGLLAVPVPVDGGPRGRTMAAHLMAERNHRRCHSEQPRAWKRPSASLWPLEEE